MQQIPFSALNAFSHLFKTYSTDFPALKELYALDFRGAESHRRSVEQASSVSRERALLSEVLLDQNQRWEPDAQTIANIEALKDPASAVVITGQQVGLFLGPLYTIFKTITTLQLARQMSAESGKPVIPMFWLAGEDHDFDEIASIHLPHDHGAAEIRYTPGERQRVGGPVGRILLGEEIAASIAQVEQLLQPSEFKDGIMDLLRDTYRSEATLLDAFARLLRRLFPEAGLVFISPDDARLKQLALPLFRKEIAQFERSHELLQQASRQLEEAYHAQVHIRPINLFLLTDEGRLPIDVSQDGAITLRGTDASFTREALLDLLEQAPERFSPNVVMRPMMQDFLLPTAAYVGGPAEVAYFAQYRKTYEWFGIPMPLIYPRASVALVERRVQRVLDRYDFSVADLRQDIEVILRDLILRGSETRLDEIFRESDASLDLLVERLKPVARDIDPTLEKSVEATRASLQRELDRLKERIVRAEKRNHEQVREALEKARAALYPNGELQERIISPLYFLNKFGLAVVGEWEESASLDTTSHQVVQL